MTPILHFGDFTIIIKMCKKKNNNEFNVVSKILNGSVWRKEHYIDTLGMYQSDD